jgi:2-hydroxychromene-2-carboxylate isomerase
MEFWFDFASTYSYVAALRVELACAEAGVPLRYRPFLLGPIFTELLGIKDSPFNIQPVRGRYMWRDLERLTGKYGLPWRRPSVFPRNGILAARMALCAGSAQPAFVRAVFHANFAEDRDIASPEVLCDLLGASGAQTLERAQTPEIKAQLRANTAEARQLGIFGAPDFTVGSELFFGQDRLDDAIEWARRAPAR